MEPGEPSLPMEYWAAVHEGPGGCRCCGRVHDDNKNDAQVQERCEAILFLNGLIRVAPEC